MSYLHSDGKSVVIEAQGDVGGGHAQDIEDHGVQHPRSFGVHLVMVDCRLGEGRVQKYAVCAQGFLELGKTVH